MNKCADQHEEGCKTREQIETFLQGKSLWVLLFSQKYLPEQYGSETIQPVGKVHLM